MPITNDLLIQMTNQDEYDYLTAATQYLNSVMARVAEDLGQKGQPKAAEEYFKVIENLNKVVMDPLSAMQDIDEGLEALNESFMEFLQTEVDGISNYARIRDQIAQDQEKSNVPNLKDQELGWILRRMKKDFRLDGWDLTVFQNLEEHPFEEENDLENTSQRYTVGGEDSFEEEKSDEQILQEEFEADLKDQKAAKEGDVKVQGAINEDGEAHDEKVISDTVYVRAEAPVEEAAPGEVSYRRYIELHTGDAAAGLTQEQKITSLANCYAAMWLTDRGRSFDLKAIHSLGEQLKSIYNLDKMSERSLSSGLQNPTYVRTMEGAMAKQFYGVLDVDSWQNQLKGLYENMQKPRITNSTEYKKLYAAIGKAATAKDPSAKEVARLNMEILARTENYLKGKESLRQFEGGQARFDYAIDALCILDSFTAADQGKRLSDRFKAIDEVRRSRHEPTLNLNQRIHEVQQWGTQVAQREALQLNRAIVK